jgi:hypothetical protein
MIAMRMRKTPFKTALLARSSSSAVPGDRSTCIEISPVLRCFSRVALGFRPFAAPFGRPLRNVFHTDCICSIRTGRRTTRHSSKNLSLLRVRDIIGTRYCFRFLTRASASPVRSRSGPPNYFASRKPDAPSGFRRYETGRVGPLFQRIPQGVGFASRWSSIPFGSSAKAIFPGAG